LASSSIDRATRFDPSLRAWRRAFLAGNVEPFRAQAIRAARTCPNVFLETCSSFRSPGVVEELVQKAGAERVLYGSDTPLMDPRCQIGKILTADISDEAKRLLLGENACRLLGI